MSMVFYIAESNHRIRKVGGSGNISAVAGTLNVSGIGGSGDGGAATSGHPDSPIRVILDAAGIHKGWPYETEGGE